MRLENLIDISTTEKKEELKNLFSSFKKKGDIYAYYNVSGNKKELDFINKIAEIIGFDFSSYKNKKYCLNCGKELTSRQNKFCSSSCSASYNNKKRIVSDETKEKISEALKARAIPKKRNKVKNKISSNKKNITKIKKYCLNCGKELTSNRTNFCSTECSTFYKQREHYKYFLNNPLEFCRGNYSPRSFKKFIIEEQGNKCAICGMPQEWNDKPLVFVLDHIDGNASNNRRDNLRCICPNCDSQLDTFKSKNKYSYRRNYWKEKIIRNLKKEE